MAWLAMAASVMLLACALGGALRSQILPTDDFIEYWSAGRLNAMDRNPYSVSELAAVQRSAGRTQDVPLVMWNTPWTLTLAMPFGLLDYASARLCWLALHLGLVFFSASRLWRLYGGSSRRNLRGVLIALAFVPTLFVLRMGQIAPLILAGVVGFLEFDRRKMWRWAGAALCLTLIKPHLLYLVWIFVALWVVSRKRWAVLGGAGLAGLALGIVPVIANPHVFGDYLAAMAVQPPLYWVTPTLGAMLRLLFGAERHWLQFLPGVAGAIWGLFYWRRHSDDWEWEREIPLLLLVSIVTSSYGWVFDYVVLVPVAIQTAILVLAEGQTRRLVLGCACLLVFDGLLLLENSLGLSDQWSAWAAPMLLMAYLLLRQSPREGKSANANTMRGQAGLLSAR
jgi:hypothetical protein